MIVIPYKTEPVQVSRLERIAVETQVNWTPQRWMQAVGLTEDAVKYLRDLAIISEAANVQVGARYMGAFQLGYELAKEVYGQPIVRGAD